MATVTLESISKNFGDTVAVDNVSLTIGDGEFVVLLGPSGCGKTTTLNMIAGLEVPTSGHILIAGERVERVPPDKRDIAMVFQSIALYPHMTAFQNIAFPLRMGKVPKPEIEQRVGAVADLLRIDELLDRKPHELSGGQRQRVALGRAVVRDPAVFLFDEPLSSLDAKLRVDMRVEIKKLHERLGATFIYVTHDQVEAMTMADRIAVMDKANLLQLGPPSEIYGLPTNLMVAGFLGNPGMNFVQGRVAAENGAKTFSAPGFSVALPDTAAGGGDGSTMTLGIRPESVIVGDAGENHGRVEGTVFETEPVGSDTFIDVQFDGSVHDQVQVASRLFKVRGAPDLQIKVGDRLPLSLPHQKIYLFDSAGRRVHPQ
jgi:multiple sugar transport system ATP-binding protein